MVAYNTFIVPYRDRIDNLLPFIRCWEHQAGHQQEHALLVLDLGSKYPPTWLQGTSGVKYLRLAYFDPFWKSKAINYGVANSPSELVTLVDVDSLMPSDLTTSHSTLSMTRGSNNSSTPTSAAASANAPSPTT